MLTRLGVGLERWEKWTAAPLMVAAVAFLVAYALPIIWVGLPAAVIRLAGIVLTTVWIGFGIDYITRLVLSKNKWEFVKHNIVDLLSVALPILRPLRLLRLVALLSVFDRIGASTLRGKVVTYAVGGTALLILVGGLAITDAERFAADSIITSFPEGIWWALVSLTTVGVGSEAPVTPTGRLIVVALMLGGIALLGIVTATISSVLVAHVAEEQEDKEQKEILAQLVELKANQEAQLHQIAVLTAEIQGLAAPRLD
ncbi:MAG: potassium channel family protein [Cellulomonadaceae bacterium]|nr:potassium channel family protein [Cellulomonadaceae bacterium]